MMKIIDRNGLWETVWVTEHFVKEVVLEFYANYLAYYSLEKKAIMFVRGKSYEFSAQMIKVFRTQDREFRKESEV